MTTTSIVKFSTEDGDVYVHVDPASAGVRRVAKPGELAGEAADSLEVAVARVKPALQSVVDTIQSLQSKPKSITVAMGIELSLQFGAVIAKGQGSANMTVSITWES